MSAYCTVLFLTDRKLPSRFSQFCRGLLERDAKATLYPWNHGAESNCHCIFSAACGFLTAAHLLALQCRTAIVRPWYKCGAIFIQPLRVILFAHRRRHQQPFVFTLTVYGLRRRGRYLRRPDLGSRLAEQNPCAGSSTMGGNRTRVCSLKGSRTDPCATTAYKWRL